jgi:putative transcriptional regulator
MMHMIRLELSRLLNGRSLYWLAKETELPYSTVHKLYKTTTKGITFVVLDKLCTALECNPGDLLVRVPEVKKSEIKGKRNE